MFGILTWRFTATTFTFALGDSPTSWPYRVVGKDSLAVALMIGDPAERSFLQFVWFEPGYLRILAGSLNFEFLRRIPD